MCHTTECDQCKTEAYTYPPERKCLLYADIKGFKTQAAAKNVGIDTQAADKMVKECSILDCVECIDDYTRCTACGNSKYARTVSGSDECISPIPEAWGKDTRDSPVKKILECDVSNCKSCENNYLICVECKSNHYLKPSGFGGECIHFDDIETTWGIDQGKYLKNCLDKNCEVCRSDYQVCEKCLQDKMFHFDGESSSAVKPCINCLVQGLFVDSNKLCQKCHAQCKFFGNFF